MSCVLRLPVFFPLFRLPVVSQPATEKSLERSSRYGRTGMATARAGGSEFAFLHQLCAFARGSTRRCPPAPNHPAMLSLSFPEMLDPSVIQRPCIIYVTRCPSFFGGGSNSNQDPLDPCIMDGIFTYIYHISPLKTTKRKVTIPYMDPMGNPWFN